MAITNVQRAREIVIVRHKHSAIRLGERHMVAVIATQEIRVVRRRDIKAVTPKGLCQCNRHVFIKMKADLHLASACLG